MARVLLINPSYAGSYGAAKAGIVNPIFPTLGLTTIAAAVLARGHQVHVLDLSYRPYDWRLVQRTLLTWRPDVVGITATTPLMNQLRDLSVLCKDVSKDICVVGGGPHVAALPMESLRESQLDLAVVGEGDVTFAEICDGRAPREILGVYYRDGDAIRATQPRPPVAQLDDLPMPAWHLFDPAAYRDRISRLLARRPPVTMAEFSRGCIYRCEFCGSKNTMGDTYRRKSPERCAEEVTVMHRLGWREFMLADDIFTTNRSWALGVSDAIARTGVDMAWSCTNGIRVESADTTLFQAMAQAGCYRVAFGFESGDDTVLRAFGKGGRASVAQGRAAVSTARAAGLDTSGYFLLGLSPDTEASMLETIRFARSLPLDMVKFGVAVLFPGTPMFADYERHGLIRSYDWDDYHIYGARPLATHPTLSARTIARFMRKAYRHAIITNPAFLVRRAVRGVRKGEWWSDAAAAVRFMVLPATDANAAGHDYFDRDRWPVYDFTRARAVVDSVPPVGPSFTNGPDAVVPGVGRGHPRFT